MKKFVIIFAVLALISVTAAAQRDTGLPSNYPADGSTPSWFQGCPEKPLVSYSAKTWGMLPDETLGEIYLDAATRNAYAISKNSKGVVNKLYVIDGYTYVVNDKDKSIMKIPVTTGSDANTMNNVFGFDAVKKVENTVESRSLCNFKGRLAEYQVRKQVTTASDGKVEANAYEQWVDCETGIVLRNTESLYGSEASETYDIVIGPQPKSLFVLPEGYKITDLEKLNGLMGLTTGKTRDENTKDIQNANDAMADQLSKLQEILNASKKK
jgi:hypothetical protein